ncbi:MAG: UPF0280 family protein [Desulfobacterales bacterium]|nr:UPF0280 family protein [Desulfobacterales bacterium]
MSATGEHDYRERVNSRDLTSFHVLVKETDLWISADSNLDKKARDLVFECRRQLETYIRMNPDFASSLMPLPDDPFAPPIVRNMLDATKHLGIGPMASVAGAIAQYVAMGLLQFTEQVIIENGGDIFLKVNRPATVSIFAGDSPLSRKFGLLIPLRQMPMGICSSSASVGHSLSMGIADVCCLISFSAALADGAATALGNMIKRTRDLEKVAEWASEIDGILGGVAIVGDKMATWGDIELIAI